MISGLQGRRNARFGLVQALSLTNTTADAEGMGVFNERPEGARRATMTTLNNEDPADPSVHEPIIVWGVPALIQKAAFEKHCTGDCGKISMGGVINDDQTGGLFVCCEAVCPHEKAVLENYGSTMSFGRPHTVHLRALKEEA